MQVYPTTVAELVGDVCQCDGAKPALIFEDQPISYADLDQRIERAANGLVAHGVAQGDRVALLMPNIPEFVVAYYAILRCGGTVIPINVLYKAEEIAYILQDSEAKVFILEGGFAAQGIAGMAKAPSVSLVFVVGDAAPEAYIVLKEGRSATGEALIAYCQDHLAPFKAPCLIKFRDELPKLPIGKVLRRVLRDEARQCGEDKKTGS
jgi:acyl-CoA synthetase (AMP-forming)/AMP-acid ligase II